MKCIICLDGRLTAAGNGKARAPGWLDEVPDAVCRAPILQSFQAGGQQIAAPVMLDVCVACREAQLKPLSKSGLIT